MESKQIFRSVALLLSLGLAGFTGVAHAQADLLAPLHGPMTTPVRTPQDADAVCTSVLVAQFVEQGIERAAAAGKPALKEDEALAQLVADPAWESLTLPKIHGICRCAAARMPDGGADILGGMTTRDSAQAFVRALQQPAVREACLAPARPSPDAK